MDSPSPAANGGENHRSALRRESGQRPLQSPVLGVMGSPLLLPSGLSIDVALTERSHSPDTITVPQSHVAQPAGTGTPLLELTPESAAVRHHHSRAHSLRAAAAAASVRASLPAYTAPPAATKHQPHDSIGSGISAVSGSGPELLTVPEGSASASGSVSLDEPFPELSLNLAPETIQFDNADELSLSELSPPSTAAAAQTSVGSTARRGSDNSADKPAEKEPSKRSRFSLRDLDFSQPLAQPDSAVMLGPTVTDETDGGISALLSDIDGNALVLDQLLDKAEVNNSNNTTDNKATGSGPSGAETARANLAWIRCIIRIQRRFRKLQRQARERIAKRLELQRQQQEQELAEKVKRGRQRKRTDSSAFASPKAAAAPAPMPAPVPSGITLQFVIVISKMQRKFRKLRLRARAKIQERLERQRREEEALMRRKLALKASQRRLQELAKRAAAKRSDERAWTEQAQLILGLPETNAAQMAEKLRQMQTLARALVFAGSDSTSAPATVGASTRDRTGSTGDASAAVAATAAAGGGVTSAVNGSASSRNPSAEFPALILETHPVAVTTFAGPPSPGHRLHSTAVEHELSSLSVRDAVSDKTRRKLHIHAQARGMLLDRQTAAAETSTNTRLVNGSSGRANGVSRSPAAAATAANAMPTALEQPARLRMREQRAIGVSSPAMLIALRDPIR